MLMIGCANAAIPSSCAAVEADGTRFASSDEPLIVAFVLGVRGLSNSQLAVDRGASARPAHPWPVFHCDHLGVKLSKQLNDLYQSGCPAWPERRAKLE
ncbi:hypothetical protein PGT21_002621 [Puccinia graminis f. sp. tritici]|uniref:Uncharacterized protein n=1 Tax=Puccinia graminis f. sp. tritici TaxID=56615 RepID=A0A5B0SG76_PUCGR|nr:hypothetical protein PGT21_002621 [Puccinia graminis f. sp. tritici]KAA1137176.1 hypothetical protein PGTUg99_010928 [Puccinia graminis f. sp. tritici]